MTKFISNKPNAWQTALINAVTQPKELLERLELDMSLLDTAMQAAKLFPLKVPHGYIARMRKRDITDPLLRQVLPLGEELTKYPDFNPDPLQEAKANPVPGLLHKYYGRVLLIFSGNCGINCRFCFRREFPYADNSPGSMGWNQAIDYIAQNETISEVILSGGDPLTANDVVLKNTTLRLAQIPHVKRLRIHSRMPIVLPERITPELVDWMTATHLKPILVLHSNHPQEINHEVKKAMRFLTDARVTLLNHTVLLKGVNDEVEILIQLSEALFECGILPYYLNVLDKVQGAAHFDLDLKRAKELHHQLSARVSGYLVPKLACEQPGAASKILINSDKLFTD